MFISTVVVRAVIAEVENRGLHTERLLRAASIERAALRRPAAGIRYRDFDRLVRQSMELTGDPSLGLAIGARAPKTMLHVLGMLLVTSPTIRESYQQLVRYGSLVASNLDWQLSERAQLACLGYTSRDGADPETQRFIADCAIALALRFGRQFAPSEPAHEVWFQHHEPSYGAEYEQLFHCPVRFRQTSNAVLFSRALLDRTQAHADPMLQQLLVGLADDLQSEVKGDTTFQARVRLALRYETDLAKVDSESLARRWGLSRRALRRRLASEGASLSGLLDEARCQRAFDELKKPECKIKEVAEDLGYSETSAFHRAFKRWTGRTPTDYKAELVERVSLRTGASVG
jgi:AraC-like DNA-binding protein